MKLLGKYLEFYNNISLDISKDRIFTDALRVLAYGTDASFYRLIPKIVIWVQNAYEVKCILKQSYNLKLPVVFRAAGTSLSGQAITDSILVVTSRNWTNYKIHEDLSISLAPSIIGSSANEILSKYSRKIGPDPASINAAMIGGIVANNASGMCCGIEQNSYKTLKSAKIIFYDGTRLDTASHESKEKFKKTHYYLLKELKKLSNQVKNDKNLYKLIKNKFKIKNTCGYSINALIDFEDEFEILEHLLVGSEGSLAFLEEVTLKSVDEYKNKASSLMIFDDINTACEAVIKLKKFAKKEVAAAELMDRASLRSVENKAGMPKFLKTLSQDATAILVETRAKNDNLLNLNIQKIINSLKDIKTTTNISFTKDIKEYTSFWNIRKGLFPAVGAIREDSTSVVIEDIAFQIKDLAKGVMSLKQLFIKHDYKEAIIFGHALDGNVHFVFTQAFDELQKARYEAFMDDVAKLVALKYKGSLKAEHGTGRNIAPFVKLEWGEIAYEIMQKIKKIFDPYNLLNPGVIINHDLKAHLKNLKTLNKTHEIVDKCIECGFCEPSCPSKMISLSPRGRIVANRYLSGLDKNSKEYKNIKLLYNYYGKDTCATCSLCSLSCPVEIDTGNLTKHLREKENTKLSKQISSLSQNNFSTLLSLGKVGLNLTNFVFKRMQKDEVDSLVKKLKFISFNTMPTINKSLPKGYDYQNLTTNINSDKKVVYFSSCINKIMQSKGEEEKSLEEVIMSLFKKANYEIIIPKDTKSLCCSMPYLSKGFVSDGKKMLEKTKKSLYESSKYGKYPIVCDMSPCSKTLIQNIKNLKIYDISDFVYKTLIKDLNLVQSKETIALHITCSTRKLKLDDELIKLAKKCAKEVIVPKDITCCGFAGDRGFSFPELNKSALDGIKTKLKGVKKAYSTSKTCEIGLSYHSGLEYKNLLYLVDECSIV